MFPSKLLTQYCEGYNHATCVCKFHLQVYIRLFEDWIGLELELVIIHHLLSSLNLYNFFLCFLIQHQLPKEECQK